MLTGDWPVPLASAVQLARFTVTAGLLAVVAVHFGAFPFVVATAGVGRSNGDPSIRRRTMTRSRLAFETLFSIGRTPFECATAQPGATAWQKSSRAPRRP
jgi:hypothetical protein